jgi:hypothetical protein
MSGGLHRIDVLDSVGLYAELTVGTTPVELKVGGTALVDRQAVTMRPKDNAIYWGYDSSVTTTTGTRIYKDEFLMLPIGDNISVYLIANDAGKLVSIGELS